MNRIGNIHLSGCAAALVCVLMSCAPARAGEVRYEYRLIVGGKSAIIQEEMNAAASEGFRFAAGVDRFQAGGALSLKLLKRMVVMQRPQGSERRTRYQYRAFDASRLTKMQEELSEAGKQGYSLLVMVPNKQATSLFAILERRVTKP